MTQVDLYAHLLSLDLPVAYNHFDEYQETPYIVYLSTGSSDLIADNLNYKSIGEFDIELYTSNKDLLVEGRIEAKLKDLEIPYSKSETWISSEQVFQVLYEISLI